MYGRRRGLDSRGFITILRWLSLGLITAAVMLSVYELVSYSRIRSAFPPGLVIAGVPVGGMSSQQAADRLVQAYGIPVEIRYQNAVIQIKPAVVGFELDLTAMLAAADLQRVNQDFWSAFWDYIWNRLPEPAEVPLRASLSEDRLREYLKNEIAPRYDRPPSAAMPKPGGTEFQTGEPGVNLDVDRAVILIGDALRSPGTRVVNLAYNRLNPTRPSLQNLQIMIQQVIDVSRFEGITEFYLLDLQTNQELNFAYEEGKNLTPGIAFTAASTMKIPIMVSIFRRVDEPTPEDVVSQMELMIERSENDPADRLLERVIDRNLGPLGVTDDLKALGFENTFLAGYFYPGAPLLQRFETPANKRTDINTDPDLYNQTTPAEMGMLMEDIYQCSESGGSALSAVFPAQISQAECVQMIEYLSLNKIGVLVQAGLPDGTKYAHKHGWITEGDGVIHTIGDVGIVYSPGGNFIMAVYMYHPTQLVWEPANLLMAQIGTAVYNYYNQTIQ